MNIDMDGGERDRIAFERLGDAPADRAALLTSVAALANGGGGVIEIGRIDGDEDAYDALRLSAFLNARLTPDLHGIAASRRARDRVEIVVHASRSGPHRTTPAAEAELSAHGVRTGELYVRRAGETVSDEDVDPTARRPAALSDLFAGGGMARLAQSRLKSRPAPPEPSPSDAATQSSHRLSANDIAARVGVNRMRVGLVAAQLGLKSDPAMAVRRTDRGRARWFYSDAAASRLARFFGRDGATAERRSTAPMGRPRGAGAPMFDFRLRGA